MRACSDFDRTVRGAPFPHPTPQGRWAQFPESRLDRGRHRADFGGSRPPPRGNVSSPARSLPCHQCGQAKSLFRWVYHGLGLNFVTSGGKASSTGNEKKVSVKRKAEMLCCCELSSNGKTMLDAISKGA